MGVFAGGGGRVDIGDGRAGVDASRDDADGGIDAGGVWAWCAGVVDDESADGAHGWGVDGGLGGVAGVGGVAIEDAGVVVRIFGSVLCAGGAEFGAGVGDDLSGGTELVVESDRVD